MDSAEGGLRIGAMCVSVVSELGGVSFEVAAVERTPVPGFDEDHFPVEGSPVIPRRALHFNFVFGLWVFLDDLGFGDAGQ